MFFKLFSKNIINFFFNRNNSRSIFCVILRDRKPPPPQFLPTPLQVFDFNVQLLKMFAHDLVRICLIPVVSWKCPSCQVTSSDLRFLLFPQSLLFSPAWALQLYSQCLSSDSKLLPFSHFRFLWLCRLVCVSQPALSDTELFICFSSHIQGLFLWLILRRLNNLSD